MDLRRWTLLLTTVAWLGGCDTGASWNGFDWGGGGASGGASGDAAGDAQRDELVYHTLEPALAPLARPHQDRYLRATVALGLASGSSGRVTERIEANWLDLRNNLIRSLSGHTLDELRGTAAIERLQADIRARLNG
ncbi:MAG: flagellar basal body-associated FliL family protein, partial [Planctomycetota bacterium]